SVRRQCPNAPGFTRRPQMIWDLGGKWLKDFADEKIAERGCLDSCRSCRSRCLCDAGPQARGGLELGLPADCRALLLRDWFPILLEMDRGQGPRVERP